MYYYNDNLQIVEVMLDGGCTTTSAQSRRKFWTPKRKEALIGWLFLAPEIVGIFAIKRVCSWIFFVFKFIRLGYAVRRPGDRVYRI